MPYTIPPSTPADGNIKTLWVPAIADIRHPTVAELTAVTAVDISCYIPKAGFNFAPEQQYIDDPRECQKFVGQALGTVSAASTSVMVIDNTGGPYEATDNDAIEALDGDGFIVRRYGLPFDTAIAAAQKVTVLDAAAGEKARQQPEANSFFRSQVPLAVRDYAQDVSVAA